jgi:hypothetical protein
MSLRLKSFIAMCLNSYQDHGQISRFRAFGSITMVHVVQKSEVPTESGVLDHMAFWGTDLATYIVRLTARGLQYDLRRVPEGGAAA